MHDHPSAAMGTTRRLRVELRGAVQGIGFRPFVYRLATGLSLRGWVANDAGGVVIEVEGEETVLSSFLRRLELERPSLSILLSVVTSWLPAIGIEGFAIRESQAEGARTVLVLPDLATCPDCLGELLDPGNRRHRYPFTNCTNCGPHFSIIETLPYDRKGTTMKDFAMCPECEGEYADPADRRFHAQPNACHACGPSLAIRSPTGETLALGDAALALAVRAVREGRIIAMKGLGGFLLIVDARSEAAVGRLRERKARPAKPFALMVADLAEAAGIMEVDEATAAALASPQAPIVLARRIPGTLIARAVAPGNPWLGVMLPYAPLHHLLARDLGFPVVATSGNLSEEPICIEEGEALARLGGVADLFLVHDRPIARQADDSVAWIVGGETRLLRRARGYAPLPLVMPRPMPTILGLGAQQKNCIALSLEDRLFVSQHIGDLGNAETADAFERVIADFLRLYEASPVALACDLNSDYYSSQWAQAHSHGPHSGNEALPLVAVQHHHAHFAACLAENGFGGRALGVVWDGSGYGGDGTVWGGEFLKGDASAVIRAAHLRPFRLIGGEAAIREPRRLGLALLWEICGEGLFGMTDLPLVASLGPGEAMAFRRMLETGFNSPLCTSAGRLFDGVAALLGFQGPVSYEGEAAMGLEFAAGAATESGYDLELVDAEDRLIVDWESMLRALLADLKRGLSGGIVSARFHAGLAAAIVGTAARLDEETVALSGGCFQNRRLLEATAKGLRDAGHRVLLHGRLPPNDGCISAGQVLVAAARLEEAGSVGGSRPGSRGTCV